MNGTARFLRLAVGLSALVILGWVFTGHAAPPVQEGLPTDWSHHHVIFSQPATYAQVNQITSDPRYWQQWYRDNVPRPLAVDGNGEGSANAIFDPAPTGDWSENLGTGASIGAGNFPAKYGFQVTTASCSDFVMFATGLAGSSTQASVVGFTNLYSGCGGTVPTVAWAYNTGGQILTSPIIATGGSQVAFVQTAASQGILVLLKWASGGTVGAPATPTTVSNASYRTLHRALHDDDHSEERSGSRRQRHDLLVFRRLLPRHPLGRRSCRLACIRSPAYFAAHPLRSTRADSPSR